MRTLNATPRWGYAVPAAPRPREPREAQPPNGRLSFVAIHEEVRLAGAPGLGSERRLQLVEIEQPAVPPAREAAALLDDGAVGTRGRENVRLVDPRVVEGEERVYEVREMPRDLRQRPIRRPAEEDRGQRPVRRQIPRRFLRPALLRFSRDEVLYDMRAPLGTLPPPSPTLAWWLVVRPLRRFCSLLARLGSGRRLRKWRHLLRGRSFDEQLWDVTPPRGFYRLPGVRRWARDTLARAGYDPGPMLVEWEIFWRRGA